jgi:PIN domain nuclease of toxin-antitoxin system
MIYLFDTHTYYWWRTNPGRLSGRIKEILSSAKNEVLLPVAVPWEMAIKTKLGKMDAARLLENFEARETAAGFIVVRPSATQAIRSGLLPLHHRDPFDRLLAAQALDLDATLLSRDRVFDLYGVQRIWE